ncbi:MAG: tyrosine-type recombinase/integrase [Oscillospiraceae bacterium]
MYHPDSVVNIHKKILKDAGLEHLRFHDLRHTFATLALQNGVDVKTVSSMLGHFDAGLHAPHLHPRHAPDAGKRRRKDGQFHGAGDVKKQRKIRAAERMRHIILSAAL